MALTHAQVRSERTLLVRGMHCHRRPRHNIGMAKPVSHGRFPRAFHHA